MIRMPAIKYRQGTQSLYLGLMNAADLLPPAVEVDAWSPGNPTGYQRVFRARRSKRFADFLSRFDGFFHQTLLLNVRDARELKFEALSGDFGELTVGTTAFLVDGQHRRGGIQFLLSSPDFRNKFREFPIPVLVMTGLNREHEALQFLTVNTTQAGVRADLEDRLLAAVVGPLVTEDFGRLVLGFRGKRNVLTESVELSDELNDNEASIWRGRIAIPEQRIVGEVSISQRSFTQSLRLVLENDIVIGTFENFADDLVDPLVAYWAAVRELCPTAAGYQFKKYELLKTKGAFVLHGIFPQVILYARGSHTQDKFKAILSEIDEMNDAEWGRGGRIQRRGTSQGVFRALAEEFRSQLREAAREKGWA